MENLTWICHICGRERPDAKISVRSTNTKLHGVDVTQNVRYCNDNPDCVERSLNVRWIPEEADD